MNDLRARLHAGDPLRQDRGLTPVEVDRMRARIIAAARADRRTLNVPFAVVTAVATLATVAGIVLVARNPRPPVVSDTPPGAVSETPSPAPATRQLQFEAPGGTRVIWTFNPNFEVR